MACCCGVRSFGLVPWRDEMIGRRLWMFIAYRPISVSILSTGKRNARPYWPLSSASTPLTSGTYKPLAWNHGLEPVCGIEGTVPRMLPKDVAWLHLPGSTDTIDEVCAQ